MGREKREAKKEGTGEKGEGERKDGERDMQRKKKTRVYRKPQSRRRGVNLEGYERTDFHLKWKCSHKRLEEPGRCRVS